MAEDQQTAVAQKSTADGLAQARPGASPAATSGLLQTGVALIAALVAVLYPIGYTLLVLRLAITYTHFSLPTAWYAASLVPAPVVLGQVFGFTFVLTLFTTAAFLLVERIPPPPRRIQVRRTRSLTVFGAAVILGAVVLIVTRQFDALAGLAFGALVGGGSALLENLRRANRISALTRFGALAGVLFVGFTAIGLVPPVSPSNVLPQVDLAGVHLSDARVLAHTDGYWYVFTPDGVLHAVPDSQAGAATIRP